MTCYHPITAYRSLAGRDPASGKWPIVFDRRKGYTDMELQIPCGQCIGCRLEKSRQWAARCVCEASLYEHNCFITLTYSDEYLPTFADGRNTLVKRDFQLFMKRFRKRFPDEKIRFFMCGEYGSMTHRAHYHAIIFNFDFLDKYVYKINHGLPLYRSSVLEELWPYGYSAIGDVTFESAAYVARYCLKKVNGDAADEHYDGRLPEFTLMSRRPGIAHDWFEKFSSDVYSQDFLVIRDNVRCRPPAYFDRLYDKLDSDAMSAIKFARREKAIAMQQKDGDFKNQCARRSVREELQYLKVKKRDESLKGDVL